MSFIAQADYEYAREKGRLYPEAAWILSDRDVWYANPWYFGPKQPHPEDDQEWQEENAGVKRAFTPEEEAAALEFDIIPF